MCDSDGEKNSKTCRGSATVIGYVCMHVVALASWRG